MDTFKRVPSPDLTDFETVVCGQEPGSSNQPILLPRSESELASRFGAKEFDLGGNHSRPTANEGYGERATGVGLPLWPQSVDRDRPFHEFEEAETDPEIHLLKDVTDQDLAATPPREKPDHTLKSSKERWSFSGRYVIACATLALMAGVAVGVLLASKLMSSSHMAMPKEQLIVNQLNVITQGLSSLHQSMGELAARQQHIAETQKTLTSEQARLATAYEQVTLKQDHVPSSRVNRSSRNRR